MKRPEVINYIKPKKRFDGSSFGKFQKRKYIADLNKYIDHLEVKSNSVLGDVSQQRELLEWLSNEDYFNIPKDEISEILEDWQTYHSNCG